MCVWISARGDGGGGELYIIRGGGTCHNLRGPKKKWATLDCGQVPLAKTLMNVTLEKL